MTNVKKWFELACGAADHRVRMAVWTKRQETASNATVFHGYAYDSQVRAGLGVLQVEVEELLRDTSQLLRLSTKNRRYIADHVIEFVENAYQEVLAEASTPLDKRMASTLAQQYEPLKLGILGSVLLWGEIESQRHTDQVWTVVWDIMRMIVSAALGVLATLLATRVL